MHARFWWADLMERDYLQDRYRWEDNIKMDPQEVGLGTWTGLLWPRKGTGSGRFWMR